MKNKEKFNLHLNFRNILIKCTIKNQKKARLYKMISQLRNK